MRYIVLVNDGLSSICHEELSSLGVKPATIKIQGNVIQFEFSDEEKLKKLQSIRRLLRYLDIKEDIGEKEKIDLKDDSRLAVLNSLSGHSFFVEVEHLKGQENRIDVAKKISNAILANVKADVNFKKPEILIVAYHQDGKFYLGLDLGGELNRRPYRVFPHSASFTGDYAFLLVKKTGFQKGDKLLVGFGKDGAVPIEAARYSSEMVYYFDFSAQNVNAARKNAQIAGVGALVHINKCSVEDLDIKYDQNYFNKIIFHLTTKDETSINEIYSQSLYVLKKKGRMLLITRDSFDLSIHEKYKLISEDKLVRGESIQKLWLLEKK